MGTSILDPVTRAEGHLRVELDFGAAGSGGSFAGTVDSVRCMAEMYRGYENILVGHDPTDAVQIVQRI